MNMTWGTVSHRTEGGPAGEDGTRLMKRCVMERASEGGIVSA